MKAQVSAFAREWVAALAAVEQLAETPLKPEDAARELVDRAARILAAAILVEAPSKSPTARWLAASGFGAMKLISAAGEVYVRSDGEGARSDLSGPQFETVREVLRDRQPEMEEKITPGLDTLLGGQQDPARADLAQALNPLRTPPPPAEGQEEPSEFRIRVAFLGMKDRVNGGAPKTPGESWEVALEGWERFFQDNITDLLGSGKGSADRYLAAIAALLAFSMGGSDGFDDALDELLPDEVGREPEEPAEDLGNPEEPPVGSEALVEDLEKLSNFLKTSESRERERLLRREIPLSVFITTSKGNIGKTTDAKTAALWYANALHDLGVAPPPVVYSHADSIARLITQLIAHLPLSEEDEARLEKDGIQAPSPPQGSFVIDLAEFQWEAIVKAAGEQSRMASADFSGKNEGSEGSSPEKVRFAAEFARMLWELRELINITFFDRTGQADRLVDELVPTFNLGSRGVLELRALSDEKVADLAQQAFRAADYDLGRSLAEEIARSLDESRENSLGIDQRLNRIVDRVAVEQGDRLEQAGGSKSVEELREVTAADLSASLRTRDPERAERALEKLDSLIGLSDVKRQVQRIQKVVLANERARSLGLPSANQNLNFLFLGSPGTGKSTVAELMGEILGGLGAISSGHLVTRNPGDLMGNHLGDGSTNTNLAIQEALGGVLLVDDAYGLAESDKGSGSNKLGYEVINTLVEGMEKMMDDLVVILVGYEFEMLEVLKMNPGLPSRFPNHFQLQFQDYTDEELLAIMLHRLRQGGFEFDESFEKAVEKQIISARDNDGDFAGARGVRNLAELIEGNQMERAIDDDVPDDEFRTLIVEDLRDKEPARRSIRSSSSSEGSRDDGGSGDGAVEVDSAERAQSESELDRERRRFREARVALDALTGLDQVKEQINGIANRIFYDQRLEDAGLLPGERSRSRGGNHMVFTGNPGTGKTTVAEMLAQMLTAVGVVTDRKVEKVSASDLVARYMGQTGDNVKKVFMKARGKVLFIDEAYALAGGAKSVDSGQNYGDEAIDEFVYLMDAYRHDVVVVVAGYPDPMEDFLNSNPGLRSRFNHFVEFPDYDADQLLEIAIKIAADQGYVFAPKAEERTRKLLAQLISDRSFANGRTARKVIDDLTDAVAFRNQQDVAEAELEDIKQARDSLFRIEVEDVKTVEEVMKSGRELDGKALREVVEESEKALSDLDLPGVAHQELERLMKRAARVEAGDELADPAFDLIFVAGDHQADRAVAATQVLATFLERIGRLRAADVVELDAWEYFKSDQDTTTKRVSDAIDAANGKTLLVHKAHLLPAAALMVITDNLSEDDLISVILRVPDGDALNRLIEQDPELENRIEADPLNLNRGEQAASDSEKLASPDSATTSAPGPGEDRRDT